MTFTRCIALALGAAALATSAMSQQFPDHTLRFVVGYPPGQNVDMMARAFADAMGKELGQNIIVDNKPGANGILGAQTVKTAKPMATRCSSALRANSRSTSRSTRSYPMTR